MPVVRVDPDTGPVDARRCTSRKEVRAFVERWNGTANLCYALNPTRDVNQPKKTDITVVEYLNVDIDPADTDPDIEAVKTHVCNVLKKYKLRATFIVDSGNGFNVAYLLDDPIPAGTGGWFKESEAVDKTLIDELQEILKSGPMYRSDVEKHPKVKHRAISFRTFQAMCEEAGIEIEWKTDCFGRRSGNCRDADRARNQLYMWPSVSTRPQQDAQKSRRVLRACASERTVVKEVPYSAAFSSHAQARNHKKFFYL